MAIRDPEQIERDLREAGLRVTPARVEVLRLLRTEARPLSHADVAAALDHRPHNKATLYRNLVDMVEAGLLRRVVLGDKVWRFEEGDVEDSHHAQTHAHFICVQCGTVSCLPEVEVKMGEAPSIPSAVHARDVEVQLRGVCDECD
jgi:Fur family ferric uptake transcriptional regulator